MLKIISDLAPKNSCGVDDISFKLLQRISIITAAPLAHIINQSLCTWIFPDRLKIARVMPLYKKDDPHLVDNYRPISVLPAISKVFERVVFSQLHDYMHTKKYTVCQPVWLLENSFDRGGIRWISGQDSTRYWQRKNTIIRIPRPIQGIWYPWSLNSTEEVKILWYFRYFSLMVLQLFDE